MVLCNAIELAAYYNAYKIYYTHTGRKKEATKASLPKRKKGLILKMRNIALLFAHSTLLHCLE